ncbi:hypothetical protein HFK74_01960|uniref:hypothetical protein n=1 Tax=Pseudomonas sp. SbOxS1 TaxID=2723884 RepID=UPI0015D254DF|nr:hypothetical protein [Pseudomonas sp. SbOxS1]NYU01458.1 hypothetical protein [Pseudomonas sp. SbOxS1]
MNQTNVESTAGALDPIFNGNGILRLPHPAISGFQASAVLTLAAGKLIVVIPLLGQGAGFAVARLNEDASLDKDFDDKKQGFVHVDLEQYEELKIFGISAATNGGWLIFGSATLATVSGMLIVRQLPNGQLDTSLNGTGILHIPNNEFGNSNHDPMQQIIEKNSYSANQASRPTLPSLVEQADGKFVLLTYGSDNAGKRKGIVLRRNLDGSRDLTFNGTGFAIVELADVAHESNTAAAVAVQADGHLLVCGQFNNGRDDRGAFVTRLDTQGRLDPGFNSGRTVTISNTTQIGFNSVTVRKSDGAILVAGYVQPGIGESHQGLIVVLNTSGSYNLVFNRGKPLYSALTPDGSAWYRCAWATSGSIVVAGGTGNGYPTEILTAITARLVADGSLDPTFNEGKGFAIFNDDEGYESTLDMTVMEDGRIVVCGALYNIVGPWPDVTGGWVLRYLA